MTIASRTSPIEVFIGKGDVRTIQLGKTWAQFEYLQKGFEHTYGVLAVYHLQSEGYQQVSSSQIPALASIDPAMMATCIMIGETSRIEAVEQFRRGHPNS